MLSKEAIKNIEWRLGNLSHEMTVTEQRIDKFEERGYDYRLVRQRIALDRQAERWQGMNDILHDIGYQIVLEDGVDPYGLEYDVPHIVPIEAD